MDSERLAKKVAILAEQRVAKVVRFQERAAHTHALSVKAREAGNLREAAHFEWASACHSATARRLLGL